MFDDGFWSCLYVRLCQGQVRLVHPKVELLAERMQARLTSDYRMSAGWLSHWNWETETMVLLFLVASTSEGGKIPQNKKDTNNTQIWNISPHHSDFTSSRVKLHRNAQVLSFNLSSPWGVRIRRRTRCWQNRRTYRSLQIDVFVNSLPFQLATRSCGWCTQYTAAPRST